ncbi:MAG: TM1812 family CRISPR-associated protein [Candidatus Hodarchaeales archaeon]
MKPYDPKLHPDKTLEENIANLIAWIRTSNRGTASVLKNISDRLLDISKTEESLKSLETSQVETLNQINDLLEKVTEISVKNSTHEESTDFQNILQNSLDSINKQIRLLTDSIKKNHEDVQSEITSSLNKLEMEILDMKSDIISINSQLKISSQKKEAASSGDKTVQQELAKSYLTDDVVEISGIDLKKRLVEARTHVYEKTEGLAPRFRKMMDNLMGTINDNTLYSRTTLELLLVEGLRYIREIYHNAPIG